MDASIPAIADGLALAASIRRGELSVEELLARVVERIDAINPAIHAVVARWEADEDFEPRGPFGGVPLLLKDLLAEVPGTPLAMGSALLRGHVCARESPMVRRLRTAGLRPFGRTSVPEFGFLPVTEPHLYGPCRNPWDPARSPGGSSGGAAAAVAAGIVPLAHGTDAGGSLRVPAACCGLFALKPSRGRVIIGEGQDDVLGGLTAEHAITRSVRDSAVFLAASSATPPSNDLLDVVARDPGRLRIGLVRGTGAVGPLHPDCVSAVESAAALCESLGHKVLEVDRVFARTIDLGAFFDALADFVTHAVHRTIEGIGAEIGRRVAPEEVEVRTWAVAEHGARLGARAMLRAALRLEASGQAL
ncbi:MAG: amidase, partial [Myxococcales bacterium]|nr:amidase [Myxococcales bacterium]